METQIAEEMDVSRFLIVDAEGLRAGLIVDSVSEVSTLDKSAIKAPGQLIASSSNFSPESQVFLLEMAGKE